MHMCVYIYIYIYIYIDIQEFKGSQIAPFCNLQLSFSQAELEDLHLQCAELERPLAGRKSSLDICIYIYICTYIYIHIYVCIKHLYVMYFYLYIHIYLSLSLSLWRTSYTATDNLHGRLLPGCPFPFL